MKRKTFLTIGGILIACAAIFYYFYFASTNMAIQNAESFLFRRMAVTRLNDDAEFRHFYITNRQHDESASVLINSFGSARQDELTLGSYDVRIESSLGLGMIINPTEWFQNEEIQIDALRKQSREEFLRNLRAYVDDAPGRSLLIVIHGFREAYESALRKTAFVASVLDIDTPVLVFDWPGDQGSSLRGYRAARSVADESGADLARALTMIIDEIQPDNLAVLANSMGGEVVVQAFSELVKDERFADSDRELGHVVLTAPDVDHAEFNDQFKNEITALADDLTVYVSSNDRALLMSRLINRGRRLGESTLSPDQLDEAEALSLLVEPGSNLISVVDVTPVNRTRNFHNFSLETPEFFDDLFLRLTGDEGPPRNRLIYRVQTPGQAEYWVLTRGR